jgi:hypothetical protein
LRSTLKRQNPFLKFNEKGVVMAKNLGQLLNQAKKIQEKLLKIQEELSDKTVEAQSGGGMVSCIVNGKQEVVSIKIANEVLEEKDVELIEDLIIAAVNEALNRSREMAQEEMAKATGIGGMQLPFGM